MSFMSFSLVELSGAPSGGADEFELGVVDQFLILIINL